MPTQIANHIIEKLKEKSVAGPVSEGAIQEAEHTLGVSFPPSYRQFLEEFGAATIGFYEIFGLSETDTADHPPLWRNVVKENIRSRGTGRGSIPTEYIVFTSDGQGCRFFIDTAQTDAKGECPVVGWGPGVEGMVVATSFYDFIDRAAQGVRL